jgi:MipA family protein
MRPNFHLIPWRVDFELETTYADENYMNTYFGSSRFDSTRSGLPYYQAGASLRDVTFSTNIGLFFNPSWGVFMRLSTSQLLGDAENSPIVDAGSRNQHFAGLGVFYRFD